MTVDYRKLNQVVTLIAAAVLDVVSLLDQMYTAPSTQYAAVELANAFLCIPVSKGNQSNALSAGKAFLPQGCINFPSLCHNLGDLSHLSFPLDIMLVHCIDDILLIGLSEQEVATTLDSWVRYQCVRGWAANSTKMQGPFISVTFLGVQ